MKPLVIAGILLAVLGAFIVFRGGIGIGTQRNVMRVGDMQVSAEEQHMLPAWSGGVAIVAGALLIGAGVRKRGHA